MGSRLSICFKLARVIESHAASFALLAYASSWLKRHQPAAFLAALLNSQPMGFYRPAQLIQDARRNGVEVRPVDVMVSTWDATLEDGQNRQLAVRLGMNCVSGLEEDAAHRIIEARAINAFENLHCLASRSNLDKKALHALASANALASLVGNRREASWQAVVSAPEKGILRKTDIAEEHLELPAPGEAETIVADYRSTGLTLGRHPLSFLRERLRKEKFLTAEVLNQHGDGAIVRACGIVTVRQRPMTAKGVVFVTLEDETGPINVIVWPDMVEKYRQIVYRASLLAVYGKWQNQSNVRHLVSLKLVDMSHLLGQLETRSRDFC
jgi:error-prone DNA polymerase